MDELVLKNPIINNFFSLSFHFLCMSKLNAFHGRPNVLVDIHEMRTLGQFSPFKKN